MRCALATAVAILCSTAASAQEIRERLAAANPLVLQSGKQPADLELCVGDAVSRRGVVAALREGQNRVIITATEPQTWKVVIAIELNGSARGTTIVGHFYPAGSGQRYVERLEACL